MPWWTFTSQGFVGVYVFFALSGYLITSLLLEERNRYGEVSLPIFWGRRAARLLPAVFALVAVTLVIKFAQDDMGNYLADALPVLFYVGNWVAAFGTPDALGVWGHTWSLSVEEQFYIVWPLLLIGALWFGKRKAAIIVTIAAIVTSVTLRVALYNPENPMRAIRGTDTMADMLLYGCLLALLLVPGSASMRWLRKNVAPWSGWVGLATILAVVAVPMPRTLLHLVGAPATAIGTCLLILCLTDQRTWALHRFFSIKALVYIGLLSYSLYVWHTIAFSFFHDRFSFAPLNYIGSLVTAVVIALGSYYVLERPIREHFRKRLTRKPIAERQEQAAQF